MLKYVAIIALLAITLAASSELKDDTYYFSWSTGNDVNFASITPDLKLGQIHNFPSTKRSGTTAIAPFRDASNNLNFHIWRTFDIATSKVGVSTFTVDANGAFKNEKMDHITSDRADLLNVFEFGENDQKFKLLFPKSNDVFSAKLNNFGIAPGLKNRLFNNTTNQFLIAQSVTRGGHAVLESVTDGQIAQTTIRRLSSLGRPTGAPIIYTAPQEEFVTYFSGDEEEEEEEEDDIAADNTNIVFLADREFKNLGASNQESRINLRIFDLETGQIFGNPKHITRFAPSPPFTEFFGSVVISQKRDLLLYTLYNPTCNKFTLLGQRLNPLTGARVGKRKLLLGCSDLPPSTDSVGVYGLDITSSD
jgi:hypothetical protein